MVEQISVVLFEQEVKIEVFYEGSWRVDNSWNEECPNCGSMKYIVEPYAEGVAGRCPVCGYETTE